MNEQSELIDLVRTTFMEVSERPLPDIALETPIAELGIDSISVAEIVTRVEDELGIEIPAPQWIRVRTLQQFIDVVEAARQKTPGSQTGQGATPTLG